MAARRIAIPTSHPAPTVVPGQYKIIGTNFTNPAFPLVRYDTGDLATVDDRRPPCACGYGGRIVELIDGREEDFVILADGSRIGRMDHIFKDMIDIKEAQIKQAVVGQIEVLVVPGRRYNDATERKLRAEFANRIGDRAEITLRLVDEIERTGNGKLRFVISTIGEKI